MLSRRLPLGAAEPIPEGELQVVEAVPMEMTPRRKMLASQTKKKMRQSKAVEMKNSDFLCYFVGNLCTFVGQNC
jgi:hypothetical protein